MIKIVAALLLAMLPVLSWAQVLSPPPVDGQVELEARLQRSLEGKDLVTYSALLDPDLKVYEDAKLVAASRAEWTKRFGPMLIAQGVSFSVKARYRSSGRILFVEYFNSAASWGGDVPAHCCWSTDASAYEIKDGRIASIYRLRGGEASKP